MPAHEYTADEALKVLLSKLEGTDPDLARHVRHVIDSGKEVEELEPARRRRAPARTYRLRARLTAEEALFAALDCLQAYFVEQPLYANSALAELAASGISRRAALGQVPAAYGEEGHEASVGVGLEKSAEIEVGGATQISTTETAVFALHATAEAAIEEQMANILRLRQLLAFGRG